MILDLCLPSYQWLISVEKGGLRNQGIASPFLGDFLLHHYFPKVYQIYLGYLYFIPWYRYIAAGLSILGLGSFLFSLPHFLSEKLHIPVSDNDTSLFCSQQNNSEGPISIQTSMSNYLLVFIFGQILHGVGAAPILSLGNSKYLFTWWIWT